MDIFIYTFSPLTTPRDVIEEMLEEGLGSEGAITGGGSGNSGSNIDIEVYGKAPDQFLGLIRRVLIEAQVPSDTVIEIEGKQFKVYE